MKTEKQCYTVSPRTIQTAQKSSRMNFSDNRSRTIAQAKMINAIRGKTIQRYVCLLKDAFTKDFVENVSIDYALKRAGGPLEIFSQSNFSTIQSGETLYFVAHGKVGEAGAYSTDTIANRLIDSTLGLKHDNINIKFTSCYAGVDSAKGANDSVINKLKARLNTYFRSKHYRVTNWMWNPYRGSITGAMGASVKSNETGDIFSVIDDRHITLAGQIETQAEAYFIESKLCDKNGIKSKEKITTYIEGAVKVFKERKISKECKKLLISKLMGINKKTIDGIISELLPLIVINVNKRNGQKRGPKVQEKVEFITALTYGFYEVFKKYLAANSCLLPVNSAMKTV